jgi:SAM-dependent methyltransferase
MKMSVFGKEYSQIYDLLYKSKDYKKETEYLNKLIKKNYKQKIKNILDIGCGTGKHASLLADKGYQLHGVDMSPQMISIAKKNLKEKKNLLFSLSNISNLKLKKKFDVIISVFHVMSYQTKNNELIKAFEIVKKHLISGGIFIFDFWYGPAVLTDLPVNSIKKIRYKDMKISRFGKPYLKPEANTIDMKYSIFIENKNTKKIKKKKEIHTLRFFFDTELELICRRLKFKILKKYEWMSLKKPDLKSRNVVWVIKK